MSTDDPIDWDADPAEWDPDSPDGGAPVAGFGEPSTVVNVVNVVNVANVATSVTVQMAPNSHHRWVNRALVLGAVLVLTGLMAFYVLTQQSLGVSGRTALLLVGLTLVVALIGGRTMRRLGKKAAILVVGLAIIATAVIREGAFTPAVSLPSFPIAYLQQDVPAASQQLVVVSAATLTDTTATVQTFERNQGEAWRTVQGPMAAHLGRSGFHPDRTEGDGSSPVGVFSLTESFGIKSDPGTKMPYRQVGNDDWWVSDSSSPLYNTWQTRARPLPWNEQLSEHLVTFAPSYDYSVVIDYNRPNPVPRKGSAIFLHVDNGKPTSGCVSVDEGQLRSIMQWLDPAKHPTIVMGDEAWLLRPAEAPPVTAGASGGLHQVAPRRILDTREGIGAPAAPLGAGTTIDVVVAGGETTVPAEASAVALNLTLTGQTEDTFLTVYPKPSDDAQGPPLVSNVNGVPREQRANLVIVAVGAGGKARVYNHGGRADVVADVVGYVAPAETSRFEPVVPYRILDTRGAKGASASPLAATEEREIDVPDAPAGATGVIVNVTAVDPEASTWVAAFRGATPWAGTSTVNTGARETTANLAVVPLSVRDTIELKNANGHTHVVVDVEGFVVSGGSRFVAAASPVRVLDSREGVNFRGRLSGGAILHVPVPNLPAGATAIAVTITGVDPSDDTFLQAGATGGDTSNVNLRAGDTRANLAIVPVVNGHFDIVNHTGTIDVVADVSGWFVPDTGAAAATVTAQPSR